MSDTTDTTDRTDTAEPTDAADQSTGRDVVRTLYWVALGAFVLLAAIALLQFYLSASRAISVWVTREYRPLFQAAFNLAVLLAAGVGISLMIRRLTVGRSGVASTQPDGPLEEDARSGERE
jgi:membrane protein implicated in regulation of membrane protease activity